MLELIYQFINAKTLTVSGLVFDVIGVLLIFCEWWKQEQGAWIKEMPFGEIISFNKTKPSTANIIDPDITSKSEQKIRRRLLAIIGTGFLVFGFFMQILAQFL